MTEILLPRISRRGTICPEGQVRRVDATLAKTKLCRSRRLGGVAATAAPHAPFQRMRGASGKAGVRPGPKRVCGRAHTVTLHSINKKANKHTMNDMITRTFN